MKPSRHAPQLDPIDLAFAVVAVTLAGVALAWLLA